MASAPKGKGSAAVERRLGVRGLQLPWRARRGFCRFATAILDLALGSRGKRAGRTRFGEEARATPPSGFDRTSGRGTRWGTAGNLNPESPRPDVWEVSA